MGAVNGHAVGPTIPASAGAYVRCQIGRKLDEPEREDVPVFLLEGATYNATQAYLADLQQRGFRYPTDAELLGVIVLGLESVRQQGAVDEKTFHEFRRVIEQWELLTPWDATKDGPTKPWDRRVLEAQWTALVRWAEESVAALKTDIYEPRRTWSEEWPKAVCRAVLRGWEGRAGTCEVVGKYATDATMATLSDAEVAGIAAHWLVMSRLTEAQKKTSVSSPPSSTTPGPTRKTRGRTAKAGAPSRATMNGTTSSPSIPGS